MKTAVSIPDDLLEQADRLARRTNKSRSELFSDALREYLARHVPAEVTETTETMNQVVDDLEQQTDQFMSSAARRVLERAEW